MRVGRGCLVVAVDGPASTVCAVPRLANRARAGETRRRMVAGSFIIAAVMGGCSPTLPPTAAVACAAPTGLVPYPPTPELTGAPIGPLLIRGPYPPGSKDATALGFKPGRPFKMIVLVARNMDGDVALTGARCADGQPLRFWLNKGGSDIWNLGPGSTPVPDDLMASTGDLRAVLPRIDAVATSGFTGYNGYILFPTAGAYRIEGFYGGQRIGEATIVVSEEPYPPGQ
jgi:hypothetical protein